jgi:hypothetical protein
MCAVRCVKSMTISAWLRHLRHLLLGVRYPPAQPTFASLALVYAPCISANCNPCTWQANACHAAQQSRCLIGIASEHTHPTPIQLFHPDPLPLQPKQDNEQHCCWRELPTETGRSSR